jgi:ankyrin repeat protein
LKSLPKTLDDTYARILINIDDEDQHEARRTLLWLAFSERPLLIKEVAEAAVVDPQLNPPFDPNERLRDPCNDIIEILGSLVTISLKGVSSNSSDDDSDDEPGYLPGRELRLAHFSVKEYLVSKRIHDGEASRFGATDIFANHFIMQSCLLYIFHYGESDSKTTSTKDLEYFPLLQYACQFWYTHARSISTESQENMDPVILRFFLSDTALFSWLRVYRPDQPWGKPFQMQNDIGPPLYYASDIGLEVVVRFLLDAKGDVDAKDSEYGRTALYRAAENGHDAVVRLLLEAKANVDAKDNYGRTALHRAAGNGHEAVVRLLLEKRPDIDAKNEYGRTALHRAARRGHEGVVQLLLEAKANVDAKDNYGWTALHRAASYGQEAVVQLLLDAKGGVNVRDDNGWMSLHLAAKNGHEAVVRLLLEHSAEVDAKDNYGWTALDLAADIGHEAVVRLLQSI